MCLRLPAQLAKTVPERGPKSLAIHLESKFRLPCGIAFRTQELWLDDRQGLPLGLKLELCCLTNELERFDLTIVFFSSTDFAVFSILGPYHLFSTPPLNFSLHPKIFPLRQIGCHSHKMLRESRGDYHCLCLLTIFFHFCVTRNGITSGTV